MCRHPAAMNEHTPGGEQHRAGAVQRGIHRREDRIVNLHELSFEVRNPSCPSWLERNLSHGGHEETVVETGLPPPNYATGVVVRRLAIANARANSSAENPPSTLTASVTVNGLQELGKRNPGAH